MIYVYASKADHICIIETWLEPNNDKNLNIPERTFSHASYGRGKGCGIFSLSTRKVSKQNTVIKEKYQIMSMIDETNKNFPYQVILVYLSSKCPLPEVVEDLSQLLVLDMTTIITGDFNFDRKETNVLSTFLTDRNFNQAVSLPTHIQGRTLDHCYTTSNVQVKLTRHSPYYSDHSALCIKFNVEEQ